MDEIDEVVREFAIEAREGLDEMEHALVALEADPTDGEQTKIVFRVVHTIKGTCGFFGFERLERLSHAGEQLLSALRDEKVTLGEEGATALLELLDVLRGYMDTIEATGEEGDGEHGDLLKWLEALGDAEPPAVKLAPLPPVATTTRVLDEQDLEVLCEFFAETREGLDDVEACLVGLEQDPADLEPIGRIFRVVHTIKGTCSFFGFNKLETLAHTGEHLLSDLRDGKYALTPTLTSVLLTLLDALRTASRTIEASSSEEGLDFGDLCAQLDGLRETQGAAPEKAPDAPAPAAEPEQPVQSAPAESSVRVATPLLDELVSLVGELVLTRNQMVQRVRTLADPILTPASQRLNFVATQLQEAVMKTRMQPMQTVFKRFPRLVRDVSRACGKDVTLDLRGGGTELDRTLIEAIKDPLTHILRNCIDHGIESPEVRAAQGKPEAGVVAVAAYHKGGFVNIEITDDGAGIDVERLKTKAVANGTLTAEAAQEMSVRESLNLIFLAGLSTAKQLTAVSGRGVGMDVVKSKIEANGGAVEISTELGVGTSMRLKIPLTLAIVPALMVECGGEVYALPQASLLELIRVDPTNERHLEQVGDARYHRLRGRLLPLVWLRDTLGLDPPNMEIPQHVAVLQAGDHTYGLVVDRVCDSLEIVVKPLDTLLSDLSVYAGTMITGEGRASLILDPVGVATVSRLAAREQRARAVEVMEVEQVEGMGDGPPLLLFETAGGGRMAIPLDDVARLEEIEREKIEEVGARAVVQYRGEILPMIFLDEALPDRRSIQRAVTTSTEESAVEPALQVIVHAHGARQVGLVVGSILDTAREDTGTRAKASRPGIAYTFVQGGRITERLDLRELVGMQLPDFYRDEPVPGA